MKSLYVILILGLTTTMLNAQDADEAIKKTETDLTDGSKKSWIFYKTVETMGIEQSTSQECVNDILTFDLDPKTYTGKICDAESSNNKTWYIEGEDPYEQYIIMGKRYMIDIYKKTIDGEKVQVLRLKQISTSKSNPSVGHFYKAVE